MTAFVERRELLLGLAALPVASRIAVAETYPSRPVRIPVATSAGGGTDLVARFIAQQWPFALALALPETVKNSLSVQPARLAHNRLLGHHAFSRTLRPIFDSAIY